MDLTVPITNHYSGNQTKTNDIEKYVARVRGEERRLQGFGWQN
jgi:hypothetical protein